MSTTAMGITGDVVETANELIIQNRHLTLTPVRGLDNQELHDAAQLLNATLNSSTRGELYKTYLPANARLQNANTLCGQQATSWVVMVHTVDRDGGVNLDLAFFSGDKQPNLTPAAISTSKELCGTFWYQK
jgi:hypothetical protein